MIIIIWSVRNAKVSWLMSKYKIVVSSVESILPIYEVINNEESVLVNMTPDKNIVSNEINYDCLKIRDDSTEQDLEYSYAVIDGLEGKEQLVLHIKKERNYKLMRQCKKLYAKKDKYLHCEICNFSFFEKYGDIGLDFIEGHHIYPIAELKEETTIKSTDILMICSNCHRMIHRKYPCLTKDNLKEMINSQPILPDSKD